MYKYFRDIVVSALTCIFFFASAPLWADYRENATELVSEAQMLVGVSVHKNLQNHLRLGLEEEIKLDRNVTRFNRGYTTLNLRYQPIHFIQLSTGYTLKASAYKGSDPKKFLQHRVYADVTFLYPIDGWQFSLRERLQTDIRADSVNLLERPKAMLYLRSRVQVQYTCKTVPLIPYANLEVSNTLNARQLYDYPIHGGQYVNYARVQMGLKYRIRQVVGQSEHVYTHTLNFFYRFQYDYSRVADYSGILDATDFSISVPVNATKEYLHCIGISYELGH